MKTTFKIAMAELAQLFYSPIAWFLLVAFIFQAGLAYTGALENLLTQQETGGESLRWMSHLTSQIFAPPYGIWTSLAGKLFLYLPLLTMGLMSREINAGTIKLLYSSPTTIAEIILGKFLAMMFYNLLLVGILGGIVVLALFNIQSPDAGLLFAGLLGIYLLLCTYAAIGLFMSSLTSYQVVAALSTLVVLAALNYVGTLWQDIDFVRDLTYFLSISGRAEHMLLGLITTKDILYFGVIIFIFLNFSIYKLQSARESKSAYVKTGRYALILVCALALGYVTSRPGFVGYLDATAGKQMTLTPPSQQLIKGMDSGRLEVTTYINLLDNRYWYGRPDQRNADLERWEPYLRFKPDISFKYVYFYDSSGDKNLYKYNAGISIPALAERYAKSSKARLSSFKTPAEIRKDIDLRPEQNRYVMQLKYNGRKTFLRLFDDQLVFPTETETDAALKRLMHPNVPKIAFVQGDQERGIDKLGDRHYKKLTNEISFRNSLINQGFDVLRLSLKDEDIPHDIAVLVIADPKSMLDTVSLLKLQKYIDGGGNLLIAGEPGKQAILNPILRSLGIQLMDGMVVQQSKDFSPDLVMPLPTGAAYSLTRTLQASLFDSLCVTMRGTTALSYSPNGAFTVTPFLMTPAMTSWNKKIRPTSDELETAPDDSAVSNSSGAVAMASPGTMVTTIDMSPAGKKPEWKGVGYSHETGDSMGPLPVLAGLTRKIGGKEQRIVVSGDADFLSTSELGRNNIRTSNFSFSTALFSWFSNGEFPVDAFRPESRDNRLDLTSAGLGLMQIFLLGILPGIVLVAGAIVLIRRKRK